MAFTGVFVVAETVLTGVFEATAAFVVSFCAVFWGSSSEESLSESEDDDAGAVAFTGDFEAAAALTVGF